MPAVFEKKSSVDTYHKSSSSSDYTSENTPWESQIELGNTGNYSECYLTFKSYSAKDLENEL